MDIWLLLLAFLFVLANGFFVAAEFAIVKVRSTQIVELAEQGSARAKMARKLIRHLDAYLSATQLGITLSSLALGWIGEPAFHHLIQPLFTYFQISDKAATTISATVAFAIISVLHIVLGELAPKSIAIQKPVATTLWTAHLLHAFYVVTFPAIWLLNGTSRALLRVVGIEPAGEHAEVAHSSEELRLILASSEKAGILSEENREIIEGVFQFSKRTARQIMVPRTDVVILSTTKTIEENLETIRITRHTRYPLCEGSLDNTIGLIHVKDLFLAQLRGPGRGLLELKREVLFVPENSTVDSLLSQFIESKTHMAVVLDEYGGSSGIVSLENITEELFGQIQDEFDRERPEIEPLGNGRYRVRGDYLIEDLADRLKIDLGEPEEETVGGYVAARLGREVTPGDKVELGDLTISVLEAERFRVRWVLVTVKAPPTEMAEEEESGTG
ncbi:MAG TPA: hemolysin family protein [Thermoanaerobaculia bacterium]|jgi:CBS domain containing-hemolysin-like protein|nr:hemolysin family protein [Thermoanaerobaculia bacterium]